MDFKTVQTLVAMCCYMACVIGIGLVFARRANQSSDNYFLGGRTLGPWVTAMSAEASDMSGWLLMGLPGVAYWCGLADAAWTAIGLARGHVYQLADRGAPAAPLFRDRRATPSPCRSSSPTASTRRKRSS